MKSPNAAYQSRRWASDPAFRLRKYKTDRARILGIKPWQVPDPKPKTGIGIEKHRDKFVVRVRERGKRVTLGRFGTRKEAERAVKIHSKAGFSHGKIGASKSRE